MNIYNRNLLILFNTGWLDEKAIEQEVRYLNTILRTIDDTNTISTVFELVNRNKITSDPKKILKEFSNFRLRPFRFLINKN